MLTKTIHDAIHRQDCLVIWITVFNHLYVRNIKHNFRFDSLWSSQCPRTACAHVHHSVKEPGNKIFRS